MNYSEPSSKQLIRGLAALLPSQTWNGAAAEYPKEKYPEFLELANAERLLPVLGSQRILDLCRFPDLLAAELRKILALNTKRNESGQQVAIEVIEALNVAGIVPILMKGVAFLLDGLYPVPGARIQADLDMVVPEAALPQAVDVLMSKGFATREPAAIAPFSHHHPGLRHPEIGICVELHRWFVAAPWRGFLPEAEVWSRARPATRGKAKFLLLGHTDAVVHNFVHARLHHGFYFSHALALRTVYDCALFVERYDSEIDWAEVRSRAKTHDQQAALAWHLELCAALFPWAAGRIPVQRTGDPLAYLGDSLPAPLRTLQLEWWNRLRLIRQDPRLALHFAGRLKDPASISRLVARHAKGLWDLTRTAAQ